MAAKLLRVSAFGLSNDTKSPAVAEKADCTVYDALINDHFDNNTLPFRTATLT